MVVLAAFEQDATAVSQAISPGANFQAAVNALTAGDTLTVNAGTYPVTATIVVGSSASGATITAAAGAVAVIDFTGTGSVLEINGVTQLTVRGLVLRGDMGAGINVIGGTGLATTNNVTIEDNEIDRVRGPGLIIGGTGTLSNLIVRRNTVHNTGEHGFLIGCTGATCVVTGSDVAHNLIHNTGQVVNFNGVGIAVQQGSNSNTVRDNVIHDTAAPCLLLRGTGGSPPNIVERNVAWGCGTRAVDLVGEAVVQNNILVIGTGNGLRSRNFTGATTVAVTNLRIVNNTIVGTSGTCMDLQDWATGANMRLANNALYCEGAGGTALSFAGSSMGVTFSRNYVRGTVSGVAGATIAGNPAATDFVAPTLMPVGDVWPKTGSSLRGTADAAHVPTDDFNKHTRLPPYDVGAYQADSLSTNPGWMIMSAIKPDPPDTDEDAWPDSVDNCPMAANPFQTNNDTDALGDACDPDMDGDGLMNGTDACPLNPAKGDMNGDGIDDGCDLMCFRTHIGVPGQPAPPTIDGIVAADVGWRGAHRVTFGNGTTEPHVAFQALRNNGSSHAYLSFEVKNDTDGPMANDIVAILLRPSFNPAAASFLAGNSANDIRIFVHATGSFEIAKHNGTSWTPMPIGTPTGMTVQVQMGTDSWDVEMVFPTTIAAGGAGWVDFGNHFKFYVNVMRVTGTTVSQFVWPDRGQRIGGDYLTYPYDNHEWGVGTQAANAVCNGVFLTWADVGTNNSPPNSILLPSTTNPTATNTFFANVHNLTWDSSAGNFAVAQAVRVRFRIADWGIAGVGNNPSWRAIPDPPGSICNAEENPTCAANIPAATSAAAPGTQSFLLNWTVSSADASLYQAPTGYPHQCILVELDSMSGANITTKSVTRNMDFSAASSVFRDKAKISAMGLGKPRRGSEHGFVLQQIRHESPPVQIEKAVRERAANAAVGEELVPGHPGRPTHKLRRGDWLSATTWLVHGYRETGNYVEIDGVKYQVTEPVGSFGYVVTHQGLPADSWSYELVGDGIGYGEDGFYRTAVPENGAVEILTRAEAELGFWKRFWELLRKRPWLWVFVAPLLD